MALSGWPGKNRKVVTFALASKLLQLRTFKGQKWKAETLAVRSCIPKNSQSPKTRSARSIWRWTLQYWSIYYRISYCNTLYKEQYRVVPELHMFMARTWLQIDLAHRVFGLWKIFGVELRTARVSAFHFWHLKVRSCNSFDARAKSTCWCILKIYIRQKLLDFSKTDPLASDHSLSVYTLVILLAYIMHRVYSDSCVGVIWGWLSISFPMSWLCSIF